MLSLLYNSVGSFSSFALSTIIDEPLSLHRDLVLHIPKPGYWLWKTGVDRTVISLQTFLGLSMTALGGLKCIFLGCFYIIENQNSIQLARLQLGFFLGEIGA